MYLEGESVEPGLRTSLGVVLSERGPGRGKHCGQAQDEKGSHDGPPWLRGGSHPGLKRISRTDQALSRDSVPPPQSFTRGGVRSPPNGSRLSCGRLARRRKGSGRSPCLARGTTLVSFRPISARQLQALVRLRREHRSFDQKPIEMPMARLCATATASTTVTAAYQIRRGVFGRRRAAPFHSR